VLSYQKALRHLAGGAVVAAASIECLWCVAAGSCLLIDNTMLKCNVCGPVQHHVCNKAMLPPRRSFAAYCICSPKGNAPPDVTCAIVQALLKKRRQHVHNKGPALLYRDAFLATQRTMTYQGHGASGPWTKEADPRGWAGAFKTVSSEDFLAAVVAGARGYKQGGWCCAGAAVGDVDGLGGCVPDLRM
jgi:hypothetical protein